MKLSKQYMKSLRLVSAKGTLNIDGRPDVTRYRNLEKLGLVQGTGLRVVRLTKEGKLALKTGETPPPAPEIKLYAGSGYIDTDMIEFSYAF